MQKTNTLPDYQGTQFIQAPLPKKRQNWQLGKFHSTGKDRCSDNKPLSEQLSVQLAKTPWQWPSRQIYFFSDLHADADAFFASLVASGGIRKTGTRDKDFELSKLGKHSRFVIGGDCFDKGPSNLRLLRAIRLLIDRGAIVHILAGNHDIRVKLGMRSVDQHKKPESSHFFIRMGRKAIPFLKEIQLNYLTGKKALKHIPDADECRRKLYPVDDWELNFRNKAQEFLGEKAINKEIKRINEKCLEFEQDCQKADMDIRTVYAAAKIWQSLFLKEEGEFYWYYRKMQLALHKGSFLYVHAGLDDQVAAMILQNGVKSLNRQYKTHLQSELFAFYYGALANTIRTKYRDVDLPMTTKGVKMLNKKGVYAIVHGHKNMRFGQRIMLRNGLVNFECDASVDKHTRKKEHLDSLGAAVTIFRPEGQVLGISSDYPFIKVFNPEKLLQPA